MNRENNSGVVMDISPFTLHSSRLLYPSLFAVFIYISLLFTPYALPPSAFAADKLVVKDAEGTSDVFKISDTGNINIIGADSYNAFRLNFAGHAGGTSHLQISTGQSDSRLTFMAGDNSDYAPRFQVIGAQDSSGGPLGWAIFDYGSFLQDLPNARFQIRHYNPSGVQMMIHCYGRDKVVFPTGNIGIGTDNPQGKLDVNGPIYQRGGVLHADYVFNPNYKLESIEEHARYMWENRHLKAVPGIRIDQNGRQFVEVGSQQRGIIEELEKAHIYIEQLNNKIKELESKVINLEQK